MTFTFFELLFFFGKNLPLIKSSLKSRIPFETIDAPSLNRSVHLNEEDTERKFKLTDAHSNVPQCMFKRSQKNRTPLIVKTASHHKGVMIKIKLCLKATLPSFLAK